MQQFPDYLLGKTELAEANSLYELLPFFSCAASGSPYSEAPDAHIETKRQNVFGLQAISHLVDAQRNEMLSAKKQDAGQCRHLV